MIRKELKKRYTETLQPMGVFQVKNLANGKIFIDSGLNIHGKMNRCKFQLNLGSHMNRDLQEDFKSTGPDDFTFEIIDYLKPGRDKEMDYARDLEMLEEMWMEKLQPFDEKGYNERKL
jgi:hypothetical protein